MSCTRAREIDLAAFRMEPTLTEFESFARHYPTCSECAREVAEWSRLEAALRDGGSALAHPSEERLLALQDAPESLDASVRQAIERHLAGCVQCRNERAVLRRFDLAALASPAGAARVAALAERSGGLRGALTQLAETLFGVAQPALAMALLLALAVPAVWLSWRIATRDAGPASAPTPPIAQRELPAPGPIVDPGPSVPEPPLPSVPEPALEPPQRLARQQPLANPDPTRPSPPGEPPSQAPAPPPLSEPLRIAALLPGDLPAYAPDAALAGGSLDSIRVSSVVRSRASSLPRIRALGPEHRGVTREASPTLYWSLDARSHVPVELTLVAEDAAEPLLELRVDSPDAGIHALSLAERGVELAPGKPYLWFASLVPDDAQRDQDVVSGAGIVRAPADPALAQRLEATPPERRAHLLAASGYWYDAFATVSGWLVDEPDAARLREYRAALLDQAGLAD